MIFLASYKTHGLVLIILMLTSLILYANSFKNGFHYDDIHYVLENPNIRSLSSTPRFFTDAQTLSSRISGHYRPLVVFSYAVNYTVGGLNPVGYRLVNLIFHVGSAFLVYLILWNILRESGERAFSAAAGGLVFLVHPFGSEVVNYITARSSGMCAFFYLSAILCWMKYREKEDGSAGVSSPVIYYLASLLFFLFALLSKEIAFTLPLILILYDLYAHSFRSTRSLGNRKLWAKKAFAYLPFFLLLILPLAARVLFFGKMTAPWIRDPFTQLGAGIHAILSYLRLFIYPVGLSIEHDIPTYHTFWDPAFLLSIGLLTLFLGAAFWVGLRFTKPWIWISFFMFFFLIALLPTSVFPLYTVMQENRGYLAFAGFAGSAGVLSANLLTFFGGQRKYIGRVFTVLLGVILIAYAVLTIQQNGVWKDRLALWSNAVKNAPDSPRAHANLAYAYYLQNAKDRAIQEYRLAIALDPQNASFHRDVGYIYYLKGISVAAERHLLTAIHLRPDDPKAYGILGLLYESAGRLDLAEVTYLRALTLKADSEPIRKGLERVKQTTHHRK